MQLPVVQSIAVGSGLCRNYMAEMSAVLTGLEWAKNKGYRRISVASDSRSDVLYIANGSRLNLFFSFHLSSLISKNSNSQQWRPFTGRRNIGENHLPESRVWFWEEQLRLCLNRVGLSWICNQMKKSIDKKYFRFVVVKIPLLIMHLRRFLMSNRQRQKWPISKTLLDASLWSKFNEMAMGLLFMIC
ncbi:hypothetical protein MKW98_014595 [Papaver atlanticum]|uniref:RNase H type-1 domain-containing protein n=1 Tax=Papaver atlanticum TaxID=357466 RepID=A0AAD4XEF6_9MAGN|nr:hypothetical protein MKW98_014595 [Papaver atlanticum]